MIETADEGEKGQCIQTLMPYQRKKSLIREKKVEGGEEK